MTDPVTDRELASIQAANADVTPAVIPGRVTDTRSIEFMGQKFRIADKIGLMPLLKFADAAEIRVEDPRALAAMYALLRDCIHPGHAGCGDCEACKADNEESCPVYDRGDWQDFEHHAIDTKADADELMNVITATIELIAGRPTQQPATSSNGQRSSSRGSTGGSSQRRGRGSKR